MRIGFGPDSARRSASCVLMAALVAWFFSPAAVVKGGQPGERSDADGSRTRTVLQTPTAYSDSESRITVVARFEGDSNGNGRTTVEYSTSDTWPGTPACTGLTSPGRRRCTVAGLRHAVPYYIRVTFNDPDGIDGPNPQVFGPLLTVSDQVTPGPAYSNAATCTQVGVVAPFSDDANGNSTAEFERGTSAAGPWNPVCQGVAGASPRVCLDSGVTESATYSYRVTFTDADGVIGDNPQVIGPITVPACIPVETSVLSGTVTANSCRQVTVEGAYEGDGNRNGSTRFEVNTADSWPGTVGCETVVGSSPRQCSINGLLPTMTYWVRVTVSDPDGVTGANPEVLGPIGLTVCGSDQVAPTVLFLVPSADAIVGGSTVFKLQVFDAGGLAAVDPVLWSVDGVVPTLAATVNGEYDCGDDCAVYQFEVDTAGLANGSHSVRVSVADASGNTATESLPFTVNNLGSVSAGDGRLLRRTPGGQICLDCHDLATHSSQYTGRMYGSWAFGCTRCHTPHGSRNIFLVRESIATPSSGAKSVTFHIDDSADGSNPQDSYLGAYDGSGLPYDDGICEACHTRTNHYRNDGSGGDHSHNRTTRCVACHQHETGFRGGGIGPTHTSHLTEEYGPKMSCSAGAMGCHGAVAPPLLSDGQNLAGTVACDDCHSPGGSYDGVDDPTVGAKPNWSTGVYSGGSLAAGKEKWCAGCHDEGSSIIGGVAAPNVIGDEDGDYAYGTGWGFYRTGHGLQAGENYPSKGGIETVAGRPIECGSCHDVSGTHIDGLDRTFDCVDRDVCAPAVDYEMSYRLQSVGGQAPMVIPRLQANTEDTFRLCAQCHDSGPATDSGDFSTNFATWSSNAYVNRHASHLNMGTHLYPADYTYQYDPGLIRNSRVTCVTCHNVHGSTRLAMIRDGRLIDRGPGLEIWYGNPDLAVVTAGAAAPQPENIPLSASTGTIWRIASAANVCSGCHGGGMSVENRCVIDGGAGNTDCAPYRPPFQLGSSFPPILDWTGENGYVADGVDPDAGNAERLFSFRVEYTDLNNDAPSPIQLWIDKDDDGVYEDFGSGSSDEKIDLEDVDPRDVAFWDGKLYAVDIPLSKAGDNEFIYRFHTSDGGSTVELPSGSDRVVSVTNNPPVLSWTGEPYFESDGVHANVGGLGGTFTFRITCTDEDNECPAGGSGDIQLWIDENDDGYDAADMHNMVEGDAGDTDCTDGKIYTLDRTLSVVGSHDYRFAATDGFEAATGDSGPVGDSTLTVAATTNTPPLVEWHRGACLTDGVKPAIGAAGEEFDFGMKYTDPDGCPTGGTFQVWIDLDGGGHDVGERHDMSEDDPADVDCTDGKVYRYTSSIAPAGSYDYRFYAHDGSDEAVGEATADRTVEVIDAVAVHEGESIQAEISHDMTLLVYEGTYTENLSFTTGNGNNSNVTLQSACGPELTTIRATGTDQNPIYVQGVVNTVVDGFTVSDGLYGILLNGKMTVRNSIIENNGRGIYCITTSSALTVDGCTVRNNTTGLSGAGIFFNSGGPHSITNSVISDNEGDSGGGIYFQNSGAGLTIDDTVISNNTAAAMGAGIYCTRSVLNTDRVTISSNTSGGAGGGLYLKENSVATMVNSLVVDNTAGSAGGGIFLGNYNNLIGTLNMFNCTVGSNRLTNTTDGIGGGIYDRLSNVLIHNSIFWGNQAAGLFSAHEAYAWLGASNAFTFTNSDVMDDPNNFTTRDGSIDFDASCINADPFFIDDDGGDYHLKPNSPAIDAGTSTDAPSDDFDGDPRPQGSGIDMGADETIP